MDRFVLNAGDLDGYITDGDRKNIERINLAYGEAIGLFKALSAKTEYGANTEARQELIALYNAMGKMMQEIIAG
jgi:hypothetical protein